MFKGLRGFLFVGGYFIPIVAALVAMYAYHMAHNPAAMLWAGLTIIWIIDAFLTQIALKQWKELYYSAQKLCDEMIDFFRQHTEQVENDASSKEKESPKA
jgi:hypothetical protein